MAYTVYKHTSPSGTEEQLRKMSETTKKLWADPEYRQRLSDAHKGKVLPPEQRQKMSEAHKGKGDWMKGRHLSEETKAKLSRIMKEIGNKPPSPKGRKQTEEAKRKIGEAHRGFNPFAQKPMTEEHYKAFREASVKAASKPIRQLTKDGEVVAEYKSGKEAANALGLKSQSNITRCACGGLPHAYGYKWEYISEVSNGN